MPDFNQLLASSFADFARRRFGEDIELSALAPEILPTLGLQFDRPDWGFLFSELLVSTSLVQPLNAAQVSACQLRNPAGSNVVAIVEAIDISVNSVNDIAIGHLLNQVDLATPGNGNVVRDARWVQGGASTNQGICVGSRANLGAANANLILQVSLTANTPFTFRSPLVLAPNATLRVATIFNNTGLTASFHWRERRVRPDELQ